MATYAIGDVQGCFDGLLCLLDVISFDERRDTLIFLGDVVNRGDKSLQTLEFIYNTQSKMVLGNHDYHLLACYFGVNRPNKKDTFLDVLQAKNNKVLIDFLIHQDIVLYENESFFVHAGIPHILKKEEVLGLSNRIATELIANPKECIIKTYGNQVCYPTSDKDLQMQYGVNAFMRMRFCDENASLDFSHKADTAPQGFAPWFSHQSNILDNHKVYFGHWSALAGNDEIHKPKHLYPMDTGYIWGNSLSCVRLEDDMIFQVKHPNHTSL